MGARSLLFQDDQHLLRECRLEMYRGSGPGGQKRNKTSNAVRLTHLPSGLSATASEARSSLENRKHAIHRMRLKIATELREEIDTAHFEPPDWFLSIRQSNRIGASKKNEFYIPAAGLILDLLKAMHGNPAHAAVMLGISTTAIIKFLEAEAQLWTAATRIRAEIGMPALSHRGR